MIFATTGSSEPFDRLLVALDELQLEEELVVQHGVSPVRPRAARCVDFLPYGDLVRLVREARVVVTHGGVGTILSALANGKRPIVVPRLAENGEAVDDHQVEFARRLAAAKIIDLVEDTADLGRRLALGQPPAPRVAPDPRLLGELRSYLTAPGR